MNIIQEYETQIYKLLKQVSQLLAANEKMQSEINELRKSQGLPEVQTTQSNVTVKPTVQQSIFSSIIPRKKNVEFDTPDKDYSKMTADEMFADWQQRQETIARKDEEKKKAESEQEMTLIDYGQLTPEEDARLRDFFSKKDNAI